MGKSVSKFHKNVTKNYDEDSDKGYILEVDVFICIFIYLFYQKE